MRNLTLILLLGVATPALARADDQSSQMDSSDAEQASNAEIVVTARQRNESLIDIPLAVSVVGSEQLARDQINNLNDLTRTAPALELSQTFGGETNGGARLRGIGTQAFSPSVSSSVALIVDQAPVGNLAFPMLYDIAQLEVLRGPQGTLFGQGASSGVLNITTRRPEFDRVSMNGRLDWAEKGTAGAEVGEITATGGFNLPITNTLAIRVASQLRRETGLQRSVAPVNGGLGRNKDNVNEDFGIRGRLRFEPTDTLSITLNAERGRSTTDGQIFFAPSTIATANDFAQASAASFANSAASIAGGGPALATFSPAQAEAAHTASVIDLRNPAGCNLPVISGRAEFYCELFPSSTETSVTAFSGAVDVVLSDALTLNSVTSYRKRAFIVNSRDFTRRTTGVQVRNTRFRQDSDSLSQTLRLNWKTDTIDLIVGGYYSDFDFSTAPIGDPVNFGNRAPAERIGFSICAGAAPFCVNGPSLTDETTFNRTISAFADITVDVAENVEMFGGLRYDNFRNITELQAFGATTGPLQSFEVKDNNLSGRVGLSFKPDEDTNIFGSYSRGYKPPAIGSNQAGQIFFLEPEKADAFEIGIRRNVGKLQLTGNIFYTKVNNFQGQESISLGGQLLSSPKNIASINTKGFEFGAVGRIGRNLSVNLGYQFNDVKYPEVFISDNGVDIGGDQFLRAPKHKLTISGEYKTEVASTVELFVNGNVTYKSATLLSQRGGDRYTYPAHEIINTGFGVRHPDGAWTASIYVRNLTKEREPTAVNVLGFGNPSIDTGAISAWPIAGLTARVVGLSVGFKY